LGKIRERNRKQEKYLKKRRESSDWNLMKVNGNNVIKKKKKAENNARDMYSREQ
jgi:hypothetical protein